MELSNRRRGRILHLGCVRPVPQGLDLDRATAPPMSVQTAVRAIDLLGLKANSQSLYMVVEQ